MAKKNQTTRLTYQHKAAHGVVGIFGEEAKEHDCAVGDVSSVALDCLKEKFPKLSFRHRRSVSKREINDSLKKIDPELG